VAISRCIAYHAVGMQALSSVPQWAAWDAGVWPVELEVKRGKTGRGAHICQALLYRWHRATPGLEAPSLQTALHRLFNLDSHCVPLWTSHGSRISRLFQLAVAMSIQGEWDILAQPRGQC